MSYRVLEADKGRDVSFNELFSLKIRRADTVASVKTETLLVSMAAIVIAGLVSSPFLALGQTREACEREYKARQAQIRSRGEEKKDFMRRCISDASGPTEPPALHREPTSPATAFSPGEQAKHAPGGPGDMPDGGSPGQEAPQ